MREIGFVDTTLRDGNQSLWGAIGITTPMIRSIAPVMDRVGFQAIEFINSTQMAVCVRWHREDPWERIRLAKRLMPDTPLGFLTTGLRFVSWDRTPDSILELAYGLLIKNGISRFWIAEPMNDMAAALRVAQMLKGLGAGEVVVGIVYTVSDVHTDEYYETKARALRGSPHLDGIYIKDVDGLLTPDRVRTLVPKVAAAIGDLPLEMHAHCNTGLAPLCYLEAVQRGVRTLHTAISPLANGTSQPSTENTLRNVRQLGFSADLDLDALNEMARFFREVARHRKLPVGVPPEYDAAYYRHQVPGGMMSTLTRQLGEIGQAHRLDALLEEIQRVRRELGSPIMITPLSQFIATQALMNVVSRERYENSPDEVIKYALGHFGTPPAPMDEGVRTKILGSRRANELDVVPAQPTIEDLRKRFGTAISDEELVLRAVMPQEQVDSMRQAPRSSAPYTVRHPLVSLLSGLNARRNVGDLRVETEDYVLEVRGEVADVRGR